MKKVLSILLIIVVLCSAFSISAFAVDYGCDVETSTNAIYLLNLDTGKVVYEKNSTEEVEPASLTKIMTYIIVAENVDDFDNTKITITEEALQGLDPESSVMGLAEHVGEEFSVKDLLYGMMIASGNDAAWVLADYVGPTVDKFVDMMNSKAAQLKLEKTVFANPHGLTDFDHYTTAEEFAKIAQYALEEPMFMEICNTTRYKPNGYSEELKTTNYLIDETQQNGYYYYKYAKGVKTGYTDEAGKCLVSTGDNGEYKYLLVEMGAPYTFEEDINYAMIDAKNLYTWAFDNLAYLDVVEEAKASTSAPVKYVWGNKEVKLIPGGQVKVFLQKDYDKNKITYFVNQENEVEAPVKAGDKYGTITVNYDGEEVGKVDLVASEDVQRSFTNYVLRRIVSFVASHIVLDIIVLVVLIGIIVIIVNTKKRKRRDKKEEDIDNM